MADWKPIARRIAERLEIESAEVVGIAAGAPYAYATAEALPETIRKVWILSGIRATCEDSILRHYQPEDRETYRSFLTGDLGRLQARHSKSLRSVLEQSRASLPEYVIETLEENP